MQWIKRNLFLVIGGVVALALLGIAGFYLYTKIQQDQGVTEELNAATQKLETLAKRDPYPNPENIVAAKEEAKRLKTFVGEVEKDFAPAPYPAQLNNMEFRTYLDNSIARMRADAQRSGVEIPTNYWFTFAAQKGSMTFSPTSLQPLASQLADIRMICEVLFDAKVNALSWIRRVAVDSQDSSLGSQDYLSIKGSTNAYAVIMPYEVAFQGFSSELASVLEGFARVPHCFIVTNVVVEPAATAGSTTEQPGGMTPDLAARYGLNRPPGMDAGQAMRERYGMGSRYGGGMSRYNMMQQMQQPIIRPVAAPQKTTILEEKPLRITLALQAVKLKPAGTPAPAPAARPTLAPTP